MLARLLFAFVVFIIVGVVLSLIWAPYAWLVALAIAILVFLMYQPSRRDTRL
jgi:uncharacterized membrane protein YoaK (UPF0700 family)